MPSDFRPLAKHITHLTLGISNLTTLPNDTFNLMPNIHSLTVRADIKNLTSKNFNTTNLVILNFGYNNRLSKLESRLFKHAPTIEYLDLGFNQITEIENRAFQGLNNLKALFLEANAITMIRNKTFLGTKNLQRLDLSRNGIEIIEPGAFVHMKKLKSIHLTQNRIVRLPAGIFSGFHTIERIDLAVNLISIIDHGVFDNLTTLDILELGFNQISTIPRNLSAGAPNLGSLFLASNGIEMISPFELANFTQLTVLDISFNPLGLKNITGEMLAGLNGLASLEIRGCNLTQLKEAMFDDKMALEILDLSENSLTDNIDLDVFRPLDNLRFLKLEANKITEIANFTDIREIMPKLEFVNLSRNEIDCDTVLEMIEYFRNNTIEFEFGEEVDVGCQLLPVRSRLIQAYQLSNAKFNDEAQRLINFT